MRNRIMVRDGVSLPRSVALYDPEDVQYKVAFDALLDFMSVH